MLRGAQGYRTIAQRQCRYAGGLRAAPRDMQAELGCHGLGLDRVPYLPLWRLDTAIPRGANQQTHACRAWCRQDVVDIGFPITNADQAGRRTAVVRRADRIETVEPLLTLLLTDRQLLASCAFANIVRVPGPHLLRQEPQGDPRWRDGQRGRDQQAVTRRVSQWAQAFGHAQIRPVGFGRIL